MRTRPHVPRTGRRRKLRSKKTGKRRFGRSPKQLAATVGRRRVRRTRGR